MRNIDELIINRGVICILNTEMILTEENYEYFNRHLLKCFENEDSRPATFQEGPNMLREMLDTMMDHGNTAFLLNSGKIAKLMLKAISNEEKEPSGDLAVIEFDCKLGKFIALMKLDYTTGYMHRFDGSGDNLGIGIEKNTVTLPAIGQRIKRIMIYGKPDNVFIYDKDPDSWFVRGFGRMVPGRDERTNLKSVRKAVEVFTRKAFNENPSAAESFRRKVLEWIRTEEIFDVQKIADCYILDTEKKEIFVQTIQSAGIPENNVKIDREWAEKKLAKRRLRLDKDIDIYLDTDTYNDKERFKVINNGNGTVDIQIKNVRSFSEK